MANVFTWEAWDPGTSAWVDIVSSSNMLAFLGSAYGTGISPGTFQDSTHRSNTTFTVDQCADPNHMNNNKYINNTTADVNGTNYDLTASPLLFGANDVTLRIHLTDSLSVPIAAANGRMWAYETSPTTPPSSLKMLMFEFLTATTTANYQRDTGPLSSSWDDALDGINPTERGILSDQLSLEVNKYWYIGLSMKKLDEARVTNGLRFSVDIST